MAVATGSLGGRGRCGSDGGEHSALAEPLVGGLLKGDTLSGMFLLGSMALSAVQEFLDLMRAFPERLVGGGTGSASRCRRSSADRRGGGGEGGLKATTFGDLRGSKLGVRERLGILKFLPGTAGEVAGFTTSSEFRKLGWSFTAMFRCRPLGGDCGGSTVRAGAGTGRGVSGGGGNALRAGEHGTPFSLARGAARPGLFLGMGGGALLIAFVSRGLSRGGPGEAFRLEGWAGCACCGWGWSPALPMFSKRDRREETGFCGWLSVIRMKPGLRTTGRTGMPPLDMPRAPEL